ncbi:MAG TPA: archaeosortase A, partial [Methanomicrobiales archaeon]|nr:archaeosortase A [Methanomicrobiales archaeon]
MDDILAVLSFVLLLLSCASFLAYLLPTPYKRHLGALGWVSIVAFLYSQIPHLIIVENNFLYPLIAVLAIPFLYVTVRRIRMGSPAVLQLTTAAAVAFLIYAPFQYIEPLGNWLISVLVGQILWILDLLQYSALHPSWNLILRNNLRIEIILACTGIQSIAIMLGVVGAVRTTPRQKILAFLLVFPTIYILNTLRNVFVIVAYTDQWFPFLPQIAGNGEFGYESFFWAHNVLSELGALVLLIAIAYGLFLFIPDLGD